MLIFILVHVFLGYKLKDKRMYVKRYQAFHDFRLLLISSLMHV